MNEAKKPSLDDSLQAAAPLVARRNLNPTGKLSDEDRGNLQEATLAIVRQLREGRSPDEVQLALTGKGWAPDVASGFISLVSQLLAKMYLQRTWIFAGMTLFTCMIASMTVPQAAAGEFPWYAAILSLIIAIVSILGSLRNLQLYRQFRQKPVEATTPDSSKSTLSL